MSQVLATVSSCESVAHPIRRGRAQLALDFARQRPHRRRRLLALTSLRAGLVALELRTRTPLVPLAWLRIRNLATANTLGALWAAAMVA